MKIARLIFALPLLALASYAHAAEPAGAKVYADTCAACHGAALKGMPELAAPELAGPTFKMTWAKRTAADLYQQIMLTMPPTDPGGLGEAKTLDVVRHILDANGQPLPKGIKAAQLGTVVIKP